MSTDRRLLALGGTALAAYFLGAWVLLVGFAAGYYRKGALFAIVAGAFGQVALTFALAAYQAASCQPSVLNLFCAFAPLGVLGAFAMIVPGLIVGAVLGVAGWFVGKWGRGS